MRRVWLDLLGLVPPPDEVERFVRDEDPRAYEALVERLLASPHYGERWGRHWLDQARYADSNGYTIDAEREVWPYRDWVIQALNEDMPFDRFTVEQLAGDLLPGATRAQLVATGFHRNTLINQEGGTDPEQFRVESVMDRASTTGAVWLGLTVGCAQCHAHKFDPISQREYYELLAFFNSTEDVNDRGPTVPVVRGEMFGRPQTEPDAPPARCATELAGLRAAWEREELARREAAASAEPAVWTSVQYVKFTTGSDAPLKLLDDNSLIVDKPPAPQEMFQTIALTTLPQVAAVRLRVLADPALPHGGPGRAEDGSFMLTDFEFQADGVEQGFSWARADQAQAGHPVAAAIDDDTHSGWAIGARPDSQPDAPPDAPPTTGANHEAVLVFSHPIAPVGKTLQVRLYHDGPANHLIGRFALDFSPTPPPLAPDETDRQLLTALQSPAAERTPEQNELLAAAFLRAEPRARTRDKRPHLVTALQMVMRERAEPRPTFTLTRGDFTRPDTAAGPLQPGVLRAVAPAFQPAGQPATRLDLARWLVHPDNPLTPRVAVNRIWMRYFGRGLVETDEDFGSQGAAPTHPALLDWLAGELVRSGWSQKHVHRLIVSSAAYRQSSRQSAEALERDPAQPVAGPAKSPAARSRDRPRRGLKRERAARCHDRRTERASAAAARRLRVHAAGQAVDHRHRAGPVSSCALHVLLSQRALSAVFHVRRARFSNHVHPAAALEHAAPGPDDGQRRSVLRTGPGAGAARRARSARHGGCRPQRALDGAHSPGIAPDLVPRAVAGRARAAAGVRRPRARRAGRPSRGRPLVDDSRLGRSSRSGGWGGAGGAGPGPAEHRQFHQPGMNRPPALANMTALANQTALANKTEQTNMSDCDRPTESAAAGQRTLARRWFLSQCGIGLGSIALGSLLADEMPAYGAPAERVSIDPLNPLAPREPHFAPKAKRVIYLFMAGGPSQLELFEDKPKLGQLHGQKPPEGLLSGAASPFSRATKRCWARRASSASTARTACRSAS